MSTEEWTVIYSLPLRAWSVVWWKVSCLTDEWGQGTVMYSQEDNHDAMKEVTYCRKSSALCFLQRCFSFSIITLRVGRRCCWSMSLRMLKWHSLQGEFSIYLTFLDYQIYLTFLDYHFFPLLLLMWHVDHIVFTESGLKWFTYLW